MPPQQLGLPRSLTFWLLGFVTLATFLNAEQDLLGPDWDVLAKVAIQASWALALSIGIAVALPPLKALGAYIAFFSISATSLFGLTQTLTGSHSASDNLALYGLSFYTATFAYWLNSRKVTWQDAFVASSPLALVTGPVLTLVKPCHRRTSVRANYFLRFVIAGAFLHQVIATPLTNLLHLIELTDAVSAVGFAVIFEIFVYTNFCGLSLLVYGILGIFGYRIPLNFRQPFSSRNLVEFWKGWHISLSAVLKSLFYTPFRKALGTSGCIILVYLASSLWHGITLNFLLWGQFHAILYLASLYFLRQKKYGLATFILPIGIVIGRMMFADANFDRLLEKLTFSLIDSPRVISEILSSNLTTKAALILAGALVTLEYTLRSHRLFKQRTYKFLRINSLQYITLFVLLSTVSQSIGINYAVYGQR